MINVADTLLLSHGVSLTSFLTVTGKESILMPTITVTPQVQHLIWALWQPPERDENDILTRVLSRLAGERTVPASAAQATLDIDSEPKEIRAFSEAPVERMSADRSLQRSAQRRQRMRWKDYIVQALTELGGEADLQAIYQRVESLRAARGERQIAEPEATIRQVIEAHSSDSDNFAGREDLFRKVGRGRWALR